MEEEGIGLQDLLSFPNMAILAALRTKLELLQEEDKLDLVSVKAMTMSVAESSLWTSLPRAIMSPERDLSIRRQGGSVRILEAGKADPLGLGLERIISLIARLST